MKSKELMCCLMCWNHRALSIPGIGERQAVSHVAPGPATSATGHKLSTLPRNPTSGLHPENWKTGCVTVSKHSKTKEPAWGGSLGKTGIMLWASERVTDSQTLNKNSHESTVAHIHTLERRGGRVRERRRGRLTLASIGDDYCTKSLLWKLVGNYISNWQLSCLFSFSS